MHLFVHLRHYYPIFISQIRSKVYCYVNIVYHYDTIQILVVNLGIQTMKLLR